jgi:hypothetical protein
MVKIKRKYSDDVKKLILNEYKSSKRKTSLRQLEKHYKIGCGNGATIRYWLLQSKHNKSKLKVKENKKRPRILTKHEINIYVKQKIDKCNVNSEPINYVSLYRELPTKIKRKISLRSIQRYGKNILHAKPKQVVTRTLHECKYKNIIYLYMLFCKFY